MYTRNPAAGNNYNRNSSSARRYNTPGTFVQSGQPLQTQSQPQQFASQSQSAWPQSSPPAAQPNLTPIPAAQENSNIASSDAGENNTFTGNEEGGSKKWLKKGFKISMREKRRRQNRTLRRLITPKNALMVLNELAAGSQQECTVVAEETFGMNPVNRQYIAVLNIGGIEYSGKGSTKLMAKNMAAESIIRDMIIKQMNHLPASELTPSEPGAEEKMDCDDEGEQSFPMIQLASYALHKLFTEWQTEGYKIPILGQSKSNSPTPSLVGTSSLIPQPKPKKMPSLPAYPENLHPCTLLSQMRGTLEYVLLGQESVAPNGQIFTMGVTVDGKIYAGKATNKKESRKQAAKKACSEIFGIIYPENDTLLQDGN